jgi:hypothetical protein
MNIKGYGRWGVALRGVVAAVVAVAVVGLLAGQVSSQDKGQKEGDPAGFSPMDEQDLMKSWLAMTTPGKAHKVLDHCVGKWEITTKYWMGGPGTEPTVSKGTAVVKWVLGGRFIEEKIKSVIPMPDPTGAMKDYAFEGQGLTGFDNYKQMYVSNWADNTNTALISSKGSCPPPGKVLTFYSEADEPMLGVQDRMIKSVLRITGKDSHVFEMYDLHAGDDYKVMEIKYKRK